MYRKVKEFRRQWVHSLHHKGEGCIGSPSSGQESIGEDRRLSWSSRIDVNKAWNKRGQDHGILVVLRVLLTLWIMAYTWCSEHLQAICSNTSSCSLQRSATLSSKAQHNLPLFLQGSPLPAARWPRATALSANKSDNLGASCTVPYLCSSGQYSKHML
eukprot:scaffold243779_cov23-Tisochrysis_lutea.AAC.1